MLTVRLGRWFRRGAKAATAHRRLYPPLKLAQLALQERTVGQIACHYRPDVIFAEGNLLLSSAGRAINYIDPQIDPSNGASSANPLTHIEALYDYVMEGGPLSPKMIRAIPGLNLMRRLRRLDARLNLGLMQLPDALVFLDIAPETALARLVAGGQKLDRHENIHDLTHARTMYRGVVSFFRYRQGEKNTSVIDVAKLSVGQTLCRILDFIRTLLVRNVDSEKERGHLGTTREQLSIGSVVVKKALTYRYLVRYVLFNLHQGSARELTFPLSQLGHLLFREGYSAGVMKAIYLKDSQRYNLLDRPFLGYPLHRAIYHRLQILKRAVEDEFSRRLARLPAGDTIKVMTAPSGYAFDLLQPLEDIARSGRDQNRLIQVLASDLDPNGHIEQELSQSAQRVGIGFEFVRGDLTSANMREQFKRSGPYDVVVFVGLSCWLAKAQLVQHLQLIRQHLLAPGGVLFTDCFTPGAFALSGKYVGYQANYYSPREFAGILAYCGFEPTDIAWESGPERINHVCVVRIPRSACSSSPV
jgi:SAM-dependent methyltransferase